METLERLMASLPFFAGMRQETLQAIAGCAGNVRYEAGTMIGRMGDPADHFWVIREGHVGLEIHVPGRGAVTIHTAGPGDVVGFSWLLPPHELRFDLHVREAVRALMFDGRCMRGKAADDPAMGYDLMARFTHLLVQRIEAYHLQLLDIYSRPGAAHE